MPDSWPRAGRGCEAAKTFPAPALQREKDRTNAILFTEATTGVEPVIEVLQTFALPLGHAAGFQIG